MRNILSGLGLCLCMTPTMAQLPGEYITKVNYLERRLIRFEMVGGGDNEVQSTVEATGRYPASPTGPDCLTLGELSRYHGSRQDIQITKMVDMEGDLLIDQKILREEDVRDKWMTPYSRIVLGKELYEVYGPEGKLLYSYPKTEFQNPESQENLSPREAANFERYVLDDKFYQQALYEFQNSEYRPKTLSNKQGVLLAEFDSMSVRYNHHLKIVVTTEYDWFRRHKRKETVVAYGLTEDGGAYAPVQELTTDWFITEKGCCIRKTTLILREHFRREVNKQYAHYVEAFVPEPGGNGKVVPDGEYNIVTVAGENAFMIQSEKVKGETLHISIYELSGKLLAQREVTEGSLIPFPAAPSGLYLVEIKGKNGGASSIRKVLRPDSGHSF